MTQPYRRPDASVPEVPSSGTLLPPHLPVPWTDPEDANRFFERDLTHFPGQLTTLDHDFVNHCVDHGMAMAVRNLAAPVRGEMRRFWTRVYSLDVFYCPPQDIQNVWNTTTRAAFGPILADLERYWQETWLPRIRASQAFWDDFDLGRATDAELADHLAESLERIQDIWAFHFEIVYSVGHAWSMYFETYNEVFEGATRLDAMALIEGFESLTAAAGRAIWRLAELARAVPGVVPVIMGSEPREALARLRDTPGADVFLAGLDDYLQAYGRRTTSFSLSSKTLAEDPTPVLSQVKDALANPESDPRRHRPARMEDRDRAIAAARAAIEHYPSQFREEFEHRLRQAQVAVRLKEDHNFVIDYECTAAMRMVLLEVARRLTGAGYLDHPDDMAHLKLEELRTAVSALASGAGVSDLRTLVADRAAEMERFAGVEVPETIGSPPAAPAEAPKEDDAPEPGTFKGVGVSPGVARGVVRVALSFDAASALRPGEVLVATSTSQPWTPLFATAAALVTEAGGVLSHMGVIAREYRLPAISGIAKATDVLQDGMVVEVDGLAGTVRVLPEG